MSIAHTEFGIDYGELVKSVNYVAQTLGNARIEFRRMKFVVVFHSVVCSQDASERIAR